MPFISTLRTSLISGEITEGVTHLVTDYLTFALQPLAQFFFAFP